MNNMQDNKWAVWRLGIIFATVYFVEGVGQVTGLISQPLTLFMNNDLKWDSTTISMWTNIAMIPWFIKFLWGAISDNIPLFGYRRKLYLLIANIFATVGYLMLAGVTHWMMIVTALAVTNFGLAVATTLCGGLLVENGKRTGLSQRLVSLQWLFFFIASMGASYLGGQLSEAYEKTPIVALHITAAIACAVIAVNLVICWFFLDEEKADTKVDVASLKASLKTLVSVFRTRSVLIAGGFIFLYYFSPAFGNPMFLYMTRDLGFHQDFIGNLGVIGGAGYIVGSVIYLVASKWVNLKQMLYISIVLGVISNLTFLYMHDANTAIAFNFFGGICGMLATIAGLTLAAEFCPDGAEGFTYAVLMAIHNLAGPASSLSGAYLYDHVFNHQLTPLIWASAGFTALAMLFVPMLKLGAKAAKK